MFICCDSKTTQKKVCYKKRLEKNKNKKNTNTNINFKHHFLY